ncbi:hypothetical protein EUGRSUZ_J01238 [Eucalyptus grandis]|uniref:Uncharacterized protein n=3 Tax=Eucalyptus TaxID=3932 RepID=A0ACC3J4N2_EUCGR|nr:hypothetical protein EUGRSUZ_J01238 [Eucalyptus grandis]
MMEMEELLFAEGDQCRTPRHRGCQIPVDMACPPPAPRKKAAYEGRRRDPPKNGFFQPPDLELLFAVVPQREACA